MKYLLSVYLFMVCLFCSPVGYSQGMIIAGENQQSALMGTIVSIERETITLDIGDDKKATVNIEDTDLDAEYVDEFLSVGTRIRVNGKFDDNIFEADKIIMLPQLNNDTEK